VDSGCGSGLSFNFQTTCAGTQTSTGLPFLSDGQKRHLFLTIATDASSSRVKPLESRISTVLTFPSVSMRLLHAM
jgi:hypothetical protein